MTTHTTERENVPPGLGQDQRPRGIVHRTRGKSNGSITRLVSPSDLGGVIKPFVFLDRFESDGRHASPVELGWHPHSGIATVTVILDGSIKYAETTGNAGVLPAGGVEWMQAGGGVWHTGGVDSALVRGFQLWVALPPELENAPSRSQYVLPEQIPSAGPVRVILGTYDGMTSPIASPPMTYLAVTLKDGERWTFHPPSGQDVAWVSVMDGVLSAASRITHGEVAIFERAETAIELVAEGDTRFVMGSATLHPHELVLGYYSVHTSAEALSRGEAEIRRIGHQLRTEGNQSYALRSI
ncbi:pirin family protein [Burkholderia sp. BCC0405]|uniref:pirin family protein n=1 Tax=Burkholderia sp. BCC0405 TaxID=2676298 RepID=UPI0015896FDF|nr:pirin family protein [Burkholderia sp. BCC0405]